MTNRRYLFMTEQNKVVAVERCAGVSEAAEMARKLALQHKWGVFYFLEVGWEPHPHSDYAAELRQIDAEQRQAETEALARARKGAEGGGGMTGKYGEAQLESDNEASDGKQPSSNHNL